MQIVIYIAVFSLIVAAKDNSAISRHHRSFWDPDRRRRKVANRVMCLDDIRKCRVSIYR